MVGLGFDKVVFFLEGERGEVSYGYLWERMRERKIFSSRRIEVKIAILCDGRYSDE